MTTTTTAPKLKRSNDRKVTNLVSNDGKKSAIANTFGLPAGRAFSCPGATSICEKICYAGNLERIYKGVKNVLMANWELLRDADEDTMVYLLNDMIADFRKDCEKKGAEKLFRIHWDGDFFSEQYAQAWRTVIETNEDVVFWVYTRTDYAARILQGTPRLSLYFSTDDENLGTAKDLYGEGVKLAYLSETFETGQAAFVNIFGRRAPKCPENAKKIPLISEKGSACVACGLCVYGKNHVLFSRTKK